MVLDAVWVVVVKGGWRGAGALRHAVTPVCVHVCVQGVIEKSVVMGMAVHSKGASGPLADLLAHYAGLLVRGRAWEAGAVAPPAAADAPGPTLLATWGGSAQPWISQPHM